MKPIVPTAGFAIEWIALVRSSFESHQEPGQGLNAAALLTVKTNTGTEDRPLAEPAKRFICFVDVELELSAEERPLVVGSVRYAASFLWSPGDIPEDAARSTMAPAYLYSFCREHLADLGRRAGFNIWLPPTRLAQPLQPSVE